MKFNPDEDKQSLFVAGMSDKKIVQVTPSCCLSDEAWQTGEIHSDVLLLCSGTSAPVRWCRSTTDIWEPSTPSHSWMKTVASSVHLMTKVCACGNGESDACVFQCSVHMWQM